MNEKYNLDVSWETIIKISLFAIFLYFLYIIRDLIIWFVFALIISILVEPFIEGLSKIHIPRVVSALLTYMFVFLALGFFLYFSIPFLVSEIQSFSATVPQNLPHYFEKVSPYLRPFGIEISKSFQSFLEKAQQTIRASGKNIFSAVSSIFGGLLSLVFTIFVAIFLSLEKNAVDKIIRIFVPRKYENYIVSIWEKAQKKVTGWFLIRIIGCIFVGSVSFLSFYFLKANYPATLSLIAGAFDFVPIIGPTIAAIIIVLMVSLDSVWKALIILVVFGIIQLIENSVVLPVLSRKIIRISPVLVLVALFIGGKIWGVLGAILAVPLIAILYEVLKEFLERRKESLFPEMPEE